MWICPRAINCRATHHGLFLALRRYYMDRRYTVELSYSTGHRIIYLREHFATRTEAVDFHTEVKEDPYPWMTRKLL